MQSADNLSHLLQDLLTLVKDPLFSTSSFLVSSEEASQLGAFLIQEENLVSNNLQTKGLSKSESLVDTRRAQNPSPTSKGIPLIAKREKKEDFASKEKISSLLQKVAPSLKLREEIPDDREGRKGANLWKERIEGIGVVLFPLMQDEETLELMKNLAKAIDTRLVRAKILSPVRLEKEQEWDSFLATNSFRLIIASAGIETYPNLLSLCAQKEGGLFLQTTPFFLLSTSDTYKQIDKKALLWKQLSYLLA